MEFSGQLITLTAGIFAFTSGALIKNRKWLMVCIVIAAILAAMGIILMIHNYTDWIEKILPLTSNQNWA